MPNCGYCGVSVTTTHTNAKVGFADACDDCQAAFWTLEATRTAARRASAMARISATHATSLASAPAANPRDMTGGA